MPTPPDNLRFALARGWLRLRRRRLLVIRALRSPIAWVVCAFVAVLFAGGAAFAEAMERPAQLREPAPFRYSASAYPPARSVLCPGENLEWTVTIHVEAAGQFLVVEIIRTIWDLERPGTPVKDREPEYALYEEDATVVESNSYRIPALPPGRYQLRTAREADGYLAQGYNVPFTVPTTCEAPR